MQIVNAIIETARLCNLDKDVTLPEADSQSLDLSQRDAVVGAVYRQLMEIESRLLPCGLHTIGKPPTAAEAIATLVSIAALERNEDDLRGLPGLLAESINRSISSIYKGNDAGVLADVELNQKITATCRLAVASMVKAVTGRDGRVSLRQNFAWLQQLLEKVGVKLSTPWQKACKRSGFPNVDSVALNKLFAYLRFCLEQICADMELESLLRALDGEYVLPGPGGDQFAIQACCPVAKISMPSIRNRFPQERQSQLRRWWLIA